MASTTKMTTKDGREYFKIRCRISRERPTLSMNWYIPDGWSQKAIERELGKVAAEFERKCKAGEILSRSEQKAKDEEAAKTAAQIQTFREYGERVFMPAKRITNAEKTRDYYQGALDHHLYPQFGDIRMPEITSAQITSYFLNLQEGKLSHSTIKGIFITINQLMKMAYMDDTIPVNPMGKVQRPRQRKDETKSAEAESFTAEEVSNIITCLKNEPLKWRAMISLLLDTGMRRGEACGLKWESVDLKKRFAKVETNLCYTAEKGIYLAKPKTGQVRTVYFSQETSDLLTKLREEQASSCLSPFVFSQDRSPDPIHPDSPTRYLQKFGKHYSIDIHPHKLRHTAASLMITRGVDIASVSEILGHADKATTLKMYTHADEESKRRAAEVLFRAIR